MSILMNNSIETMDKDGKRIRSMHFLILVYLLLCTILTIHCGTAILSGTFCTQRSMHVFFIRNKISSVCQYPSLFLFRVYFSGYNF